MISCKSYQSVGTFASFVFAQINLDSNFCLQADLQIRVCISFVIFIELGAKCLFGKMMQSNIPNLASFDFFIPNLVSLDFWYHVHE